jgi:hypothetical protein
MILQAYAVIYSIHPKAGHGSAFEFDFWRLSNSSGFSMASLDRFVNKGHKNILVKTV